MNKMSMSVSIRTFKVELFDQLIQNEIIIDSVKTEEI